MGRPFGFVLLNCHILGALLLLFSFDGAEYRHILGALLLLFSFDGAEYHSKFKVIIVSSD